MDSSDKTKINSALIKYRVQQESYLYQKENESDDFNI